MKKENIRKLLKLKATYLMTGAAVLSVLATSAIRNCNDIKEGENTSVSISVLDENKETNTITNTPEISIIDNENIEASIVNEDDAIFSIIATGMNVNDFIHYNNRTIGTISIPGTTIHFPIVDSSNDEEWLHTNFSGNESAYGTIFLDFSNNTDFDNKVSTLFGHNMRDYKMFAGLNRYFESNNFYKNCNYAFISTQNFIYVYEFAQASRVPFNDNEIRKGNYKSDNEYKSYIELIESYNKIKNNDIDLNDSESILQLLTCCDNKKLRTAIYFSYMYKIPNVLTMQEETPDSQSLIKEITDNKRNYSALNHNIRSYIIPLKYNYLFIENDKGNKYIWTKTEMSELEKKAFINTYDNDNVENYTFIYGYNFFNLNYSYINISNNGSNVLLICDENTNIYVRNGNIIFNNQELASVNQLKK